MRGAIVSRMERHVDRPQGAFGLAGRYAIKARDLKTLCSGRGDEEADAHGLLATILSSYVRFC